MRRAVMLQALAGIRVLDLTRVRSGPTATRQLADFGAEVVKIEAPGGSSVDEARLGSDFQNLHRNKRSLTLDLKQAKGLEIFRALARNVDVVVENYRPDVKHRLGIDYEALRTVNPRLVYASISGFGQEGPYAARPGFDQIAQGMGGLMSITGRPGEGPLRAGIAIADSSAGLYCAFGILAALIERDRSGEGQWVKTSLLQAQIAMLDFQAARWLMDHDVPRQTGNDHPTVAPMGAYQTADIDINIAAAGDAMFGKLCAVLDLPALAEDARFRTGPDRSRHRIELNAAILTVTRTKPAAFWIDRLNGAGVPCGPIYAIDQTFADPQVRSLGMAQTVMHPSLGEIALVGQPVELERTPASVETPAPAAGEDTDAILSELGYGLDDIADLRRLRVV